VSFPDSNDAEGDWEKPAGIPENYALVTFIILPMLTTLIWLAGMIGVLGQFSKQLPASSLFIPVPVSAGARRAYRIRTEGCI